MRIPAVLNFCVIAGMFARMAFAQGAPSAGLVSYSKAREVLDQGVKAIGGDSALRGLKTVRRDLIDKWVDVGQGQHPWRGAPEVDHLRANSGFEATPTISFLDYAGHRAFESQTYVDSPAEYAVVVNVLTPVRGFDKITYIQEKPFYGPIAEADIPALRTRKFRRFPEGLLRMALERPETLEWIGTTSETGRAQEVISFADPAGARVFLYFDAQTHLIAKAETLRDHAVLGDTNTETVFSDYRRVGALRLPYRLTDRTGGMPTHQIKASRIAVDVSFPEDEFQPPRDFVAIVNGPDEMVVQKLSETLYLIRGSYNVLFQEFRDHVVVFEGPASSAYAEKSIELVRKAVPSKPIRAVMSTHYHYDHIAGLRAYVAAGIPIITTPDAKEVIERLSASRHSMHPDALSRRPRAPVIETVADSRILDDGAARVEIYDVRPAPHVAQMLVAYFPKEKLIFVADLLDVLTPEFVIAGVDGVPLGNKIKSLDLQIDHFVPVHGVPITGEQFRKAYELRAKLVH